MVEGTYLSSSVFSVEVNEFSQYMSTGEEFFFPVLRKGRTTAVSQAEGKSHRLQRQWNSWRNCSRTNGGEFFRKLMWKLFNPGCNISRVLEGILQFICISCGSEWLRPVTVKWEEVLPCFEEGKDDCGFAGEEEVTSIPKTIEHLEKLF